MIARGTIYLDNAAGRALRKRATAVHAADVIYCGGEFRAGDAINIAFRSADGAQYVIATGIVCCDETTLIGCIGPPVAAAARDKRLDPDKDFVVVRQEDVRLTWHASSDHV